MDETFYENYFRSVIHINYNNNNKTTPNYANQGQKWFTRPSSSRKEDMGDEKAKIHTCLGD